MKRNGRSRTGVAAKRRRARIARKLSVRAQVRLVHLWADSVVAMQSQGPGFPVSPFLPFPARHPTVLRAWVSRGGSYPGRRYPPLRDFDATTFFNVDRERSNEGTYSNLLATQT